MQERLISLFGAVAILLLAYACCPKARRRSVNLRTVGIALGMLMLLGLLLLRTPVRSLFTIANDGVEKLLGFSRDGASFVFGDLVTNTESFGTIFAFQVLPTILFFSALMSALYHVGVMPWIIERGGRFLSKTLGTTGPESFSTVADVFVGQSEAPLAIKPYIAKMTRSELNACMVAGFATTAGGVLAAYVAMLHDKIPGIAGHLIACSVLAAPASLAVAKLMLPETDTPEGPKELRTAAPQSSANLLDALATGTMDGLRLAVSVAAMLMVFLAMVAMLNAGLGWLGGGVLGIDLSLQRIFGWVFAPLAFLTGVPFEDVLKVGSLLGEKTALNEFVAYAHMNQELVADPGWLTERGRLITSYALCGFANFGSIGIQIGVYSGLAPERRADISRLALRAMLGGLLATTLVACVAGVFL